MRSDVSIASPDAEVRRAKASYELLIFAPGCWAILAPYPGAPGGNLTTNLEKNDYGLRIKHCC